MKTVQNILIVFFKTKLLVNLSAKLTTTNYSLKLIKAIPMAFILIVFSFNLKAQNEIQPKPMEAKIYTQWNQIWPEYKMYLQKTVDTTDLMMEGEFIKQIAEFDKDSIEYYYKFYKVKHVLNSKTAFSDTVVIKELGTRIKSSGLRGYNGHEYYISTKSIFCATIISPDPANSYDQSIKHLTFVEPVTGIDISMCVNDTLYAVMGYDRNIQFYKYNDLVAFLKHIKNISIPPVWEKTIDTKKYTADSLNNVHREIYFHEKDSIKNSQQPKKPKGKIKTFFKNLFRKSSTTTDVTVNIQNQNLTNAAGKNYLEYDIFLSANNNNFKFAAILMSLLYNPVNFGNSVVTTGKATVTLNTTLFNPNAYTYTLYDGYPVLGLTGLVINFPLADINYPLTQLTPTPQKFCHIKMELTNCGVALQNQFGSITSTFTNCYLFDNLINGYPADITNYQFNNLVSSCINISYINTTKRYVAGIGDILSIQGGGFGTTRGTGQVIFKNANDPTTELPFLNDMDYVNWTDNLINVKIPSYVKDANGVVYCAGSGEVKVKTNTSVQITTTQPIDIKYAILNTETVSLPNCPNPGQKIIGRETLSRANCSEGLYFKLHNDILLSFLPDTQPVCDAIRYALLLWSNATSTDCHLITDANGKPVFTTTSLVDDDESIINITNNFPTGTTSKQTMYTRGFIDWYCFANTTDFILRSSDIWIRNTGYVIPGSPIPILDWCFNLPSSLPPNPNGVPANKTDFNNTFLHELGHAFSLAHINDIPNANKELMYYSIPTFNGPISAAQRNNLTTGGADSKDGAISVIARSKLADWNDSFSLHHTFTGPTVVTGTPLVMCSNGTATLSATKPGYGTSSFLWSNGSTLQNVTVNTAGTYTVTVTNDYTSIGNPLTCVYIPRSIIVTSAPPLTVSQQPNNDNICTGGNSSFSTNCATSGVAYQWQSAAPNTSNFVDIVNSSYYSGVNTNNLAITAASFIFNGRKYRCALSKNGYCISYSSEAILTVTTPTFSTLPSVYSNSSAVLLNGYVNITGGTFSGNGVSLVGSNYYFTPTTSLVGIQTISYSLPNCSPSILTSTITVIACCSPTIVVNSISSDYICINSVDVLLNVNITALNPSSFTSPNYFKIQLSNSSGIFPANYTSNIIGVSKNITLAGTYTIKCTIPASTLSGNYKIRAFSTNPQYVGNSNLVLYISHSPCNNLFKNQTTNLPLPFKIYPNPVFDILTIDIQNESAVEMIGTVIDLTGKIILNFSMNNGQNNIDVANWPNGLYFLRVSIDEIISSRKIIVQH